VTGAEQIDVKLQAACGGLYRAELALTPYPATSQDPVRLPQDYFSGLRQLSIAAERFEYLGATRAGELDCCAVRYIVECVSAHGNREST